MTTPLPYHLTHIAGLDLLDDPGGAQLRRYLPVLALVAAPYAGLNADQDPLAPLDGAAEWRALGEMLGQVTARQTDASAPLALVRLAPPTADALGRALAAGGADGFRVAHIVAAGERDMLTLEDANGHEAYAVAEQVVRLFRGGGVQVVVLDGVFSRRMAQMLIDGTPVQAVVGTRRRVAPEAMQAFNVAFYAGLSGGIGVSAAYRAALAEVGRRADGQTDRFEIALTEKVHDVVLTLPATRAPRPLLADGVPPLVGVPGRAGFIGQRDMLTALAQDIPQTAPGIYAIYGAAGVGKSWLAAEFVARFSWRFPAGVCWLPVNAQTTAREVIAAAAVLAGLEARVPVEDVIPALRTRRALVVLDGCDEMATGEARTLAGWLAGGSADGTWVLLTGRDLGDARAVWGEYRAVRLERFTPKAARTLAMRLAVERGLDALDVDTVDDFLERSLNLPWLITRGIDMLEHEGLRAALKWLDGFNAQQDDPLAAHIADRLQWLAAESANLSAADDPVTLLKRTQGIPDAFDARLVRGLVGEKGVQHVQRLQREGVLASEGRLLRVAPAARRFALGRWRLNAAQHAHVDRYMSGYLIKTWPPARPWPPATPPSPQGAPGEPISALERIWLNNARAVLRRHAARAAAGTGVAADVLADLLAKAWPSFRAAGIAEEFVIYAVPVRDALADGSSLGRLQVALGEAANDQGKSADAGWLFRVALEQDDLDSATLAAAGSAYGRHLAQVGEADAAARALSDTLQRVLAHHQPDDVPHYAALARVWADVLAGLGRPTDAVKRYQAALAGYAEIERADLSAEAQADMGLALLAAGEGERAEDGWRRALVTADGLGLRDLAGRIRVRIAAMCAPRGDWLDAGELLGDALADCLPRSDAAALAEIWHDLAPVQARLGQAVEAAASMTRAAAKFEQAGRGYEHAEAVAALGQLQIAGGDAIRAQETLHRAIKLASELGDRALAERSASVLVRVHQLRARHAGRDAAFRRESAQQAGLSQAALAAAGLADHAVALSAVIEELSR